MKMDVKWEEHTTPNGAKLFIQRNACYVSITTAVDKSNRWSFQKEDVAEYLKILHNLYVTMKD